MDKYTEFETKFRVSDLLILESKFWTWSLRPVQPTIGSGILALKRYEESFSGISEEEGQDLSVIVKDIELCLKEYFSYDKINYLMLMMVDPHLHFHVIPRYKGKIEFAGVFWFDKGWPALPSLEAETVSDEILLKITDKLKGKK